MAEKYTVRPLRIGGARFTRGSGSHYFCSGKTENCVFWLDEYDGYWAVFVRPMNSETPIEHIIQVCEFERVTTLANGLSCIGKSQSFTKPWPGDLSERDYVKTLPDCVFEGAIGKRGQIKFSIWKNPTAKIQRGKIGDWPLDVFIDNPKETVAYDFMFRIGVPLSKLATINKQDKAA